MTAAVTRLVLRTRIRQRANMESSQFVTDTEINDLINVHLTELYDILVEASPPDYFSSDYSFNTVAGTVATALPSDFRSLIAVYTIPQTDFYRPLRQITDVERARYRAPQSAVAMVMRYVPVPPQLTTDADPVTGSFDGVSGWEELIVSMAARDCLMKEESDVSTLDGKIARLTARIESQAAKRNLGSPTYITDVDELDASPYPFRAGVNAYQLRAGFLDLFSAHLVYP